MLDNRKSRSNYQGMNLRTVCDDVELNFRLSICEEAFAKQLFFQTQAAMTLTLQVIPGKSVMHTYCQYCSSL